MANTSTGLSPSWRTTGGCEDAAAAAVSLAGDRPALDGAVADAATGDDDGPAAAGSSATCRLLVAALRVRGVFRFGEVGAAANRATRIDGVARCLSVLRAATPFQAYAQIPFGVREGETARRATAGVARVVLLRPLGEVGGDDMVAGRVGAKDAASFHCTAISPHNKCLPVITSASGRFRHMRAAVSAGERRPRQPAPKPSASDLQHRLPVAGTPPRLHPRRLRTKPAQPLQPLTDVTLNKNKSNACVRTPTRVFSACSRIFMALPRFFVLIFNSKIARKEPKRRNVREKNRCCAPKRFCNGRHTKRALPCATFSVRSTFVSAVFMPPFCRFSSI